MKVLILSCTMGQGHNSAGKAVREALEARNIPCEMINTLSLASDTAVRVADKSYVGIATHCPRGFGAIYKTAKLIATPKAKSIVYLGNKLYAKSAAEYISKNGFTDIVMPHVFPAEAMTALLRQARRRAAESGTHALTLSDGYPFPRTYAVATDYTCIPFWEETELDVYFVPHRDLVAEFDGRGVPGVKCVPTGIPVSRRFQDRVSREEARRALGLPQDGQDYLIMTGSMGFGNLSSMLEQLLLRSTANLIVLGGSNEKMKAALREQFDGVTRVTVLDFTDQVPLYMDACDLLFTKPGGLTSTEGAVRRIPLVHTPPIPGCETQNIAFFTGRGLSVTGKDDRALAEAALRLASDPVACTRMRERQAREINAHAADDIVQYMLRRAGEEDIGAPNA